MRAIAMTTFGGPEVLVETQRPDPQPAAGELLVRVTASGINRPDVLQRKGAYAPPPGASDLPGLEIAGTVIGGDATELPLLASSWATGSARWWPAAAMPTFAPHRSHNACRCRRA